MAAGTITLGASWITGYKYDLVENSHHAFGQIPFGENFALRYDRDFKKKRMNMDFPIRFIIT